MMGWWVVSMLYLLQNGLMVCSGKIFSVRALNNAVIFDLPTVAVDLQGVEAPTAVIVNGSKVFRQVSGSIAVLHPLPQGVHDCQVAGTSVAFAFETKWSIPLDRDFQVRFANSDQQRELWPSVHLSLTFTPGFREIWDDFIAEFHVNERYLDRRTFRDLRIGSDLHLQAVPKGQYALKVLTKDAFGNIIGSLDERHIVVERELEKMIARKLKVVSPNPDSVAELSMEESLVQFEFEPSSVPISNKVVLKLENVETQQVVSGVFNVSREHPYIQISLFAHVNAFEAKPFQVSFISVDGNEQYFPDALGVEWATMQIQLKRKKTKIPQCVGFECLLTSGVPLEIIKEPLVPVSVEQSSKSNAKVDQGSKVKCKVVFQERKKILFMHGHLLLEHLVSKIMNDAEDLVAVENFRVVDNDGFEFDMKETLNNICNENTLVNIL